MRVLTGTSGYGYREWKGRFYPKSLPASGMLPFYASRFETVEINHTFYQMPEPGLLPGWRAQVGAGFVFALKAPQAITHFRRLADVGAITREFLGHAEALEGQLGPLLFQLPPNMKRDLPRLRAFLRLVPVRFRVAFEFRHESWLDEEVRALLSARGAALCLADDEKLTTPWAVTADFGYLRLRRPKYSPKALTTWAAQVRAAPWKETFVYFKHEDEAKGPRLAQRFLRQFSASS